LEWSFWHSKMPVYTAIKLDFSAPVSVTSGKEDKYEEEDLPAKDPEGTAIAGQ